MINFSEDIADVFLGGGGLLVKCEADFKSGKRQSIMTALIYCSIMQKTIPDWVADELLNLDGYIKKEVYRDMNEFFNFGKPMHKTKLEFSLDVEVKESRVLHALTNLKIYEGKFSQVNLRDIAEETGVSQRQVVAIYEKHKVVLNQPRTSRNIANASIGLPLSLLAEHKRQERDRGICQPLQEN